MTNLKEVSSIASRTVWNGVDARIVSGRSVDMAIVELEPGAVVPEHRHLNEQLGTVIEGSMTFRVADEEATFGPGGTWRIPSDTPHEARAGANGAVVVEVFSPPRGDWAEVPPNEPAPPRWPG